MELYIFQFFALIWVDNELCNSNQLKNCYKNRRACPWHGVSLLLKIVTTERIIPELCRIFIDRIVYYDLSSIIFVISLINKCSCNHSISIIIIKLNKVFFRHVIPLVYLKVKVTGSSYYNCDSLCIRHNVQKTTC